MEKSLLGSLEAAERQLETMQLCSSNSCVPALSYSIWAHQFGEPGLFSAPDLTDSFRSPGVLT